MKKLLAGILCMALLLTLCACGKEKKADDDRLDVAYYAKLGKIPETDYALGMDIEKTKETLSVKDEQDGGMFDVTEGEKTVRIMTDGYAFYYEKEHAENGISCIVCLNGGFGFQPGAISVEVTDALADYDADEHPATDSETFFLPFAENCTCIAYGFGDYRLQFVFEENALCGAVLSDPQNWTI